MSALGQATIFKDLEHKILNGLQSRKSFNLLYSAKGEVDVDQFHANCDGKGPTVTLIYGKYNNVFGGYTSQSWSSEKKRAKKDSNAFLFYKNDHAEAECVFLDIKQDRAERAIICDGDFGPTFGGREGFWDNYDLQTFKRSSKKSNIDDAGCITLNGVICIGNAYQCKLKEGEVLNDDINAGKLLVKAFEVYQVIDDTLKEPWRERPDDEKMATMEKRLENLEPLPHLGIDSFNILMVGVIGAGKSSFYNTLASVFANEIKAIAQAAEEETSITNEVRAYTIDTKDKKELNIRIFDIRGFDETRGYDHELKFILDGKIPPGYVFEDQPTPQKDINLKPDPTLNDEIHLVCLVTDTTKFEVHQPELIKQVENVKTVIRKKGIPLVAVATKFDQLCPKISEDANHVYNSPKARDATKAVSAAFGIQMRHVFPIVNYIEDSKICKGKNRLALQALNSMVQLAEDHLRYHTGMPSNDDTWSDRLKSLRVAKQKEERVEEIKELSEELSKFNEQEGLRVLCFGTVHSGKSSFIDSICSALTGKICSKATGGYYVESTADVSTTEKFQLYQMKHKSEDGELKASKVYFGDMPGIQKDKGFDLDQAKRIVNGHVPDRYNIRDGIKEDSQHFIKEPEFKDQIHCVCFVIDISSLDDLSESSVKEIFHEFQNWLFKRRIPYIVVATKCDKASLAVRNDVMQVYQNKKIKAFKDKLIGLFRFKESIIYPVRNYVNEKKPIPEFDALLLDAFKEVLNLGYNYVEDATEMREKNHE